MNSTYYVESTKTVLTKGAPVMAHYNAGFVVGTVHKYSKDTGSVAIIALGMDPASTSLVWVPEKSVVPYRNVYGRLTSPKESTTLPP